MSDAMLSTSDFTIYTFDVYLIFEVFSHEVWVFIFSVCDMTRGRVLVNFCSMAYEIKVFDFCFDGIKWLLEMQDLADQVYVLLLQLHQLFNLLVSKIILLNFSSSLIFLWVQPSLLIICYHVNILKC